MHVAEAAVALALARVAVGRVPLRCITAALRLREGEAVPGDVVAADPAAEVAVAVRRATARLPWASTCLVQGIAAVAMLRRRRLDATLHLGVAKNATATDGIAAHAWSQSGGVVLTGGGVADRFTIVGTYSASGRQ